MNAQLDPRLMSLLLLILVAAVKARDRAAALAAPDVRGSKTCDAPNDYLAPELAAIPQLEPSLTQHARAAALLSVGHAVGVAVPFRLVRANIYAAATGSRSFVLEAIRFT